MAKETKKIDLGVELSKGEKLTEEAVQELSNGKGDDE